MLPPEYLMERVLSETDVDLPRQTIPAVSACKDAERVVLEAVFSAVVIEAQQRRRDRVAHADAEVPGLLRRRCSLCFRLCGFYVIEQIISKSI